MISYKLFQNFFYFYINELIGKIIIIEEVDYENLIEVNGYINLIIIVFDYGKL